MRKTKLLSLLLITSTAIFLCACQSNNKMIPANKTSEEAVMNKTVESTTLDSSETSQKQASTESATTEASKNVTQVVSRNTSEKLTDSTGSIQIAVGELKDYSRNFGSSNLIQYIGTGATYSDISYQIYEGYDEAKVLKMTESFASSANYGNSLKDKTATFTFSGKNGDFNGYTLSYTANGGRVVYQMLLVKTLKEGCVLAINYQQDNETFNYKDVAKFVTDEMLIEMTSSEPETTETVTTEEGSSVQ